MPWLSTIQATDRISFFSYHCYHLTATHVKRWQRQAVIVHVNNTVKQPDLGSMPTNASQDHGCKRDDVALSRDSRPRKNYYRYTINLVTGWGHFKSCLANSHRITLWLAQEQDRFFLFVFYRDQFNGYHEQPTVTRPLFLAFFENTIIFIITNSKKMSRLFGLIKKRRTPKLLKLYLLQYTELIVFQALSFFKIYCSLTYKVEKHFRNLF